jgi:probable DNA metabolism protein
MMARSIIDHDLIYRIQVDDLEDFSYWRLSARRCVSAALSPDRLDWCEAVSGSGHLFVDNAPLPPASVDTPEIRVSRAFVELAQSAFLHSASDRFALLYRLLWRLQSIPSLMEDAADSDVRRLRDLARAVRRDIHKMRAFVRFRSVTDAEGEERFVAWFEPTHHILRANAAFFVNRFANMCWSILTPRGSLIWDGKVLQEGPPAQRGDAPEGDPAEDMWRRYYASIFNPARLKVGAMLKEMPRKYWKNMPEAALIPDLVAGAQAREAAMVDQGGSLFQEEHPQSVEAIGKAITACTRCPIGCNGTDAVMGEGPASPTLLIVGEQPGDVEEQQGRPFVGPAGKLLDEHLQQAGIDRTQVYVTNAVKHFKFVQRGKRRLHQTPTAKEIDICRWWLDGERNLLRPRHILALGVSAARGILGRTPSIGRERGEPISGGNATVWLTVHPSFLLRVPDNREREEEWFQSDLKKVQAALRLG